MTLIYKHLLGSCFLSILLIRVFNPLIFNINIDIFAFKLPIFPYFLFVPSLLWAFLVPFLPAFGFIIFQHKSPLNTFLAISLLAEATLRIYIHHPYFEPVYLGLLYHLINNIIVFNSIIPFTPLLILCTIYIYLLFIL